MLKYLDGGFIPDHNGEAVPARDLTDEEVKHFGEEFLLGTGLYARPEKAARAAPAREIKGEVKNGGS
jgi:hypothetical protein